MSTKLPLTPDYSYISTLNACRRKFYYAHERNLAATERVPVLHAGSAGHAALERLIKTDWNVEAAVEALYDYWGDYTIPSQHRHAFLSPEHLEVVIRNFAADHADAPRAVVETGEELFGEKSFEMDWEGLTVGGRIDLVEETESGRLFVKDWKFTTAWTNSYWLSQRAPEIDHQLKLYTAATEEMLGRPVAGAYIHALYMGKKADDPPSAWENRQSSPFRLFGPFSFSPSELDETRAWIEAGLEEIEHRRALDIGDREEYAWPQNTRNRYGCSSCDFEALCSSNPVVRDGLAEARFVEVEKTGKLASGADSNA